MLLLRSPGDPERSNATRLRPEEAVSRSPVRPAASLDPGSGDAFVQVDHALQKLLVEAHGARRDVEVRRGTVNATVLRSQLVSRHAEALELLARALTRAHELRSPSAGGARLVQAYRARVDAERHYREMLLSQENLADPSKPGAMAALIAIESEPSRLRQALAQASVKLVARIEHVIETEQDPLCQVGLALHLASATFATTDSRVRQDALKRAATLAQRAWPVLISGGSRTAVAADATGALLEVLEEAGAHQTVALLRGTEIDVSLPTEPTEAAVRALLHFEFEGARIEHDFPPTRISTERDQRRRGLRAWEALLRELRGAARSWRGAPRDAQAPDFTDAFATREARALEIINRARSQLGP